MKMTVGEISEFLNAELDGDANIEIVGPGKIEEGEIGQIGFYANPKYEPYLYSTNCSALLVQKDIKLLKDVHPALIKVDNVYESIGKLLSQFSSEMILPQGISKLSSVSNTAKIGNQTQIGDFSIIGERATIGSNCTIFGQVFIANDVVIGDHVTLYPGVKIYQDCIIGNHCTIHSNSVIGSDGFGFSQSDNGRYEKIPQTGNVVIKDHVEIGACTTVDRATMGHTVIERGVKLDNLIQIGHNAQVGENTVIAAQTGVSGSTKLGKNCMVGGQVGFVGHIKVADGSMFQAKTGIAGDIKQENQKYYGYPAIGYQNYLKSYAYFRKFPEIVDKIRTLEKELDILRNSIKKE